MKKMDSVRKGLNCRLDIEFPPAYLPAFKMENIFVHF